MALQDREPPKNQAKESSAKKATPRRTPPRRGTELDKIRTRLTELFDTVAAGQQMVGVATGDTRHYVAGKAMEGTAPNFVEAWVNLAEESPAVKRYLSKMAEGTGWGEVTFATIGLLYSQAQAYGAIPGEMVNPWFDFSEVILPSHEVAAHAANNRTVPIVPDAPTEHVSENPAVDFEGMSEAEVAQAEAERITERRKRRQGPLVEGA